MIDQDHFSLFGLPRTFSLQPAELEAAWKRVATAVHPDRFATASAAEKRVASQWSARANEAYRVLKDPLSRARYLCTLADEDLQAETNTAMSPAFLMQQMVWHEQLDELRDSDDLTARQAFASELNQELQKIVLSVSGHLDAGRYTEAAVHIREWMFLDKLIAQLRAIES